MQGLVTARALHSKLYDFCRNSFRLAVARGPVLPVSLIHPSAASTGTADSGYHLQTHQGPRSPRLPVQRQRLPPWPLLAFYNRARLFAHLPSYSMETHRKPNCTLDSTGQTGNRTEKSHVWGGSTLLNPGSKTAGKPKAKATLVLPAPSTTGHPAVGLSRLPGPWL